MDKCLNNIGDYNSHNFRINTSKFTFEEYSKLIEEKKK